MTEKPAPADHPILPLLRDRWSPRAFADQMVDTQTLDALFEAARWAPSASNMQPWSFVHARRGTAGFDVFRDILNPSNAVWASKAAVLLLAAYRVNRPNGQPNAWAAHDLGQAMAHLTMEATARGLHLHQMGGFDADKARTALGLPDDMVPATVTAIGYVAPHDTLPESLRERELAPRSRKPVAEFVFSDRWGNQPQD